MNLKEKIPHWLPFYKLGLSGPAELLPNIVPQEEVATKYATYSPQNAKNYLLLQILTEVQKAGFTFERWIQYFQSHEEELHQSPIDICTLMEIDSLIVEQSVWQRKLVEGLIMAIGFTEINSDEYYYHFLLLRDLEHALFLQWEQRNFFGIESNQSKEEHIESLKKSIEEVEKAINDLSVCWYLPDNPSPLAQNKKREQRLRGERSCLLKAVSKATESERTAFGYTYDVAFIEPSHHIHLDSVKSSFKDSIERFNFGMAQCGLLMAAILSRSLALSGASAPNLQRHLKTLQDDESSAVVDIAKVGDFVFAGGLYLGEVLEVCQSKAGYESYYVRFLDERPEKNIQEDWFPAFAVRLYMDREGCRRRLRGRKELQGAEISSDEMDRIIRLGVVEAWKMGIKAYYQRRKEEHRRKRVEDREHRTKQCT